MKNAYMNINEDNHPKNFFKRKLYIIISLVSGFIIIWSLSYNFTNLAHSADSAIDNEANLKSYFKKFVWFFYFSNIANVLFFLVTTVRIFYRKGIFTDQLQIMVGTYMLIVGCVYWTAIFGISYWDAIGPKKPVVPDPSVHNSLNSAFKTKLFFLFYIFNDLTMHCAQYFCLLIVCISKWEQISEVLMTFWCSRAEQKHTTAFYYGIFRINYSLSKVSPRLSMRYVVWIKIIEYYIIAFPH